MNPLHAGITDEARRYDLLRAPTPCLWNGCPRLLWHLGPHLHRNAQVDPRIELREGGRILYWNVKDNDRKGFTGSVARGQHAEVAPGAWVRLFGANGGTAFVGLFGIGDEAAYGGYNLTYTGTITAIGPKTITVRDGRTVKRLSIYDFLAWNRSFDAKRTRAENLATMQRI